MVKMRHKLFIQLVIYNFHIFSKRNLFSKNLKVVTKPVRRQTTLKNRIDLQEGVLCEENRAVERYVYLCTWMHVTHVKINVAYTHAQTYATNLEKV